jgi:hypothetical protein
MDAFNITNLLLFGIAALGFGAFQLHLLRTENKRLEAQIRHGRKPSSIDRAIKSLDQMVTEREQSETIAD